MNNKFKRKPLARWIAFALAATTTVGIAQAAAPLAGEKIKNLATVTYEDENGNKYSAQSNEAVITVAPQYRATLETDKELSAAPGQTVYFSHTLKNTGNIEDTYMLTTTALSAGIDVNASVTIFKDSTSNGQPDAGEPEITALTLGAGQTGNIVIAYVIPATAVNGDSADIVLTAMSNMTGAVVKDVGLNTDGATDIDDDSATNQDTVTVSNGPVLVLNKESVIDTANRTITYTLTVMNTGSSAAAKVDILDVLPKVDTDNNGTLDGQTTLVANSIVTNGLLDANDVVAVETDETTLGADIDGDGATDTTKVIRALDFALAANTTISIQYAVTYEDTWAAGAGIDNTFSAFEDPLNTHTPPDPTKPPKSNTTHDEVPQNYAIIARDEGITNTASPNINDGGDDNADTNTDGTGDDDIQKVDTISAGDTVIFKHTITNNGNGDDKFNLSVINSDFPTGTVFTFWNGDGTVPLTDSDNDNIPDTGILAQNMSRQIVVKADLPSGISKFATSSSAMLVATSSGDSATTANKVSDDTTLTLGEITAPAVDVSAIGAAQPLDNDFNDGGVANAHDEGPVFLKDGLVGGTVVFPMSLANEAGNPDSFLLSFDKLPAGWNVQFIDKSVVGGLPGVGNGDTITSTPFIPAGGTFNYDAVVTISNIPAQALGTADRSTDVNGHDITNDSTTNLVSPGTDTDKDYVIDFLVTSAVDAARKDVISHAIDVADVRAIEITPDGQNQIQPGGTVDYPHKLINEGNVDEAVELTVANNDDDWSSRTLIKKGDGTLVELSNLVVNDTVEAHNPDGTVVIITLTDGNGGGILEFPLAPGQYVNVINKVFAPADAPQGEVNITTFTVTDPAASTVRSTAKDSSNVILGQVRLIKTVALDANCDNTEEGLFAEIQSSKVEPGQCAIWKISAKNEGDEMVNNVIVHDSIPVYTQYLAGSLRIDGAADPSDATSDDAGEHDQAGNKVTYYLGANPVPATSTGGELASGETATVRFTVKVDQ